MNFAKHRMAVCRGFATLLFVAGLGFGYWWLYKLAPIRRTLSPQWRVAHSEREYWREVQKGIHRGVWNHDDGFAVGRYGDKQWAQWIMAHVRPGEDMGCFGRFSHSATAMEYITNQEVAENADAWLDWWEKNKTKTQEEWIEAGFRQRGIEIDLPPSAEQTPLLLGLLGDLDTYKSTGVPKHWKYNAFRCLRDSNFDPVRYAIADRPISEEIERSLLEYARLERMWPAGSSVGNLPVGTTDDEAMWDVPAMLTPKYQLVAYSLVFAPLFLGAGLFAWSFRKRKAP